MEFSLLGAAAVGVALLYGVLWWEVRRGNAAECTRDLWDLALSAGFIGLVVGRLAAMIGDGVNPISHPGDILIVRAGVATGWAAVAALGSFAVLVRGEIGAAADGVAAAALAGLAGWHAGCLVRDACHGTPSDLPWAMAVGNGEVTRHPEGIYTALLFAAAVVVLIAWKRRVPPLGAVAALGLALAGAIRLATEPLRPSLGNRPVVWYVAALAVGLAALAWILVRTRREQPRPL